MVQMKVSLTAMLLRLTIVVGMMAVHLAALQWEHENPLVHRARAVWGRPA